MFYVSEILKNGKVAIVDTSDEVSEVWSKDAVIDMVRSGRAKIIGVSSTGDITVGKFEAVKRQLQRYNLSGMPLSSYTRVEDRSGSCTLVIEKSFGDYPSEMIRVPCGVDCVTSAVDIMRSNNIVRKLYIPNSVRYLGGFGYLHKLEDVRLSNRLIELYYNCFNRCSSLSHIDLPDSINYIGLDCFYGCALSEVELPYEISGLGNSCFGRDCILRKLVFKHTQPLMDLRGLKDVKVQELEMTADMAQSWIDVLGDIKFVESGSKLIVKGLPRGSSFIEQSTGSHTLKDSTIIVEGEKLQSSHVVQRMKKFIGAELYSEGRITIKCGDERFTFDNTSICISHRKG